MPDFTPEEADRCPHCGKVLRLPPNCCPEASDDHYRKHPTEFRTGPFKTPGHYHVGQCVNLFGTVCQVYDCQILPNEDDVPFSTIRVNRIKAGVMQRAELVALEERLNAEDDDEWGPLGINVSALDGMPNFLAPMDFDDD